MVVVVDELIKRIALRPVHVLAVRAHGRDHRDRLAALGTEDVDSVG
jgi:hypothetical protein